MEISKTLFSFCHSDVKLFHSSMSSKRFWLHATNIPLGKRARRKSCFSRLIEQHMAWHCFTESLTDSGFLWLDQSQQRISRNRQATFEKHRRGKSGDGCLCNIGLSVLGCKVFPAIGRSHCVLLVHSNVGTELTFISPMENRRHFEINHPAGVVGIASPFPPAQYAHYCSRISVKEKYSAFCGGPPRRSRKLGQKRLLSLNHSKALLATKIGVNTLR